MGATVSAADAEVAVIWRQAQREDGSSRQCGRLTAGPATGWLNCYSWVSSDGI